MLYNRFINKFIFLISSLLTMFVTSIPCTFSQTERAKDMWIRGVAMAVSAIKNDNMMAYDDALKLMEKAIKQNKKEGNWCYELGSRYYYLVPFGGHLFSYDEKKGIKCLRKELNLVI